MGPPETFREGHVMEYTFKPIGTIRSPYHSKQGMPIQGVFEPEGEGLVEVFEPYVPGLQDLEGFSHLILIYVFHLSEGFELQCRPYMEERLHGVFSTRAPRRPNPVGFSVVKLLTREGSILHISEVDVIDGTPLLDIKPYVPRFDERLGAQVGWMDKSFRSGVFRKVSDDRF
jgi:tRNA (adenine37-N6)-methyltransferase